MPLHGRNGPSSSVEPSSHAHGISKFFKKLGKKKDEGMFVAPAVPSQHYETYAGRSSPRPALPFNPATVRSVSSEGSTRNNNSPIFLSSGSIFMGDRRISAPQLYNGECDGVFLNTTSPPDRTNLGRMPSPAPAASRGYGLISVDTEGHGETAGSGMDYITQLSSPAVCVHSEHPAERLAKIRSVYDEKNRLVKVITKDIMKLQDFIQRYESEKMSKFSDFLYFLEPKGQGELLQDIELVKSELDRLRVECPEVVPPPVPERPSVENRSHWNCLQCTVCNGKDKYRCKYCELPCTRFDPQEMKVCKCDNCQPKTLQLELSNLQDNWTLVSPVNRI